MTFLGHLIAWFRELTSGSTADSRIETAVPKEEHLQPIPRSSKTRRRELDALEELFDCCEVFPAERLQARKHVEDDGWSACVAVAVATGIATKADGRGLSLQPHRCAYLHHRCKLVLQHRASPEQRVVREKHHTRFAGERTRTISPGDPTGHVTDITDLS